jgi:hypothetical protein
MARYDAGMQGDEAIAVNFARNLKTALCDAPGGDPGPADPRRVERTPAPADRGLGLRQLIRLARLHRVELVLIFNPTHVLFNEVTRRCTGAQGHWQYLWQVASIVDQETAGAAKGIELWDFHAWGPYTGERVHAGVPMRDRLWQDTGHFNPEVGTHVFAAIYGDERDFGARITVADFDANLARVEAQRTAFLAANAWIDDEIREIQARARTLRDLAPTPRMLPAAVRDR